MNTYGLALYAPSGHFAWAIYLLSTVESDLYT